METRLSYGCQVLADRRRYELTNSIRRQLEPRRAQNSPLHPP